MVTIWILLSYVSPSLSYSFPTRTIDAYIVPAIYSIMLTCPLLLRTNAAQYKQTVTVRFSFIPIPAVFQPPKIGRAIAAALKLILSYQVALLIVDSQLSVGLIDNGVSTSRLAC